MGYRIRVTGELDIDPPVQAVEIMSGGDNLKPLLPDYPGIRHGAYLAFTPEEQGGYASIKPRHGAIIDRDTFVAHLNVVIGALPGHTFSGCIELDGEDHDDISRVMVINGMAVEVHPTITWATTGDPDWVSLPIAELQALFDVVQASDFFSGWWATIQQTDETRAIAVRLGHDPMEGTPRCVASHYPHTHTPRQNIVDGTVVPEAACRWCGRGPRAGAHNAAEQPMFVRRPVVDLYKQCSFPLRSDAIAASDTCRAPAQTAVIDYSGGEPVYWWRCTTHEGMITADKTGGVAHGVEVRRDEAPPRSRVIGCTCPNWLDNDPACPNHGSATTLKEAHSS